MDLTRSLKIGPYCLGNPVILAPMAGVTDRPFRQLCKSLGAGMVVSEMVTSDKRLWHTRKSQLRLDHTGESEPRSVQIAGADPVMMAEAAKFNADNGAQIIDINMGCPAKKVCKKAAGSALMRDEKLVKNILHSVVNAVKIPVTLKIRTGWDLDHKNALEIARISELEGIKALAVHGRSRACGYSGNAEYDTIALVKSRVSIPAIANGDINSAKKAKLVLDYTQANGVMIGREAQGNPWIFREIAHYLETGELLKPPSYNEVCKVLLAHLEELYSFYGETMGVRIARKHVGWYVDKNNKNNKKSNFKKKFNQLDNLIAQRKAVLEYFKRLTQDEVLAA